MFRYANHYGFELRVIEGDQVGGMDIVLDVGDEFGGQDVEMEGWRFLSKSNTYQGYP